MDWLLKSTGYDVPQFPSFRIHLSNWIIKEILENTEPASDVALNTSNLVLDVLKKKSVDDLQLIKESLPEKPKFELFHIMLFNLIMNSNGEFAFLFKIENFINIWENMFENYPDDVLFAIKRITLVWTPVKGEIFLSKEFLVRQLEKQWQPSAAQWIRNNENESRFTIKIDNCEFINLLNKEDEIHKKYL
ncbi:MAG: hypothetical protein ACD_4C00449G0002 [uncultured bacterium (gcode 4)]|uniref:Uncharacterized protein n=1 Tax=uncultured bacterium (gcode 4) TaxID=1234023 RepID=K2F4Q4_9BACT|nr:MAG: hypothetical protein ACD_4C00449G0002 [uncultured bacterium (gcode 4)]